MRFNDQNFTTVPVRWYFCAPNARPLPWRTVYNSGIWWSDKSEGVEFGETGKATFCDGTPPPWGFMPWPQEFPTPEPPLPLWFTILQNVTTNEPPFVAVGQTFRLTWDPIFEWWISETIAMPPAAPMTLQIVVQPGTWRIGLTDFFFNFLLTQPRLDVVPYCLFPGFQPLGTEIAWRGDEFTADPLECSIFGVCVRCMNVAGLALPIPIYDFLEVRDWVGNEIWTGQVTWFDPHTQVFPSSARFDQPGIFEWECPPGIFLLRVELQGGGGGGGCADALGTAGGGGGGAGAWRISKLFDVVPGAKYPLVVGAGGRGGLDGINTSRDGRDGESTSWNAAIFAKYGCGGKGNANGAAYALGGAGGKETEWATPEFSRSGFDGLMSAIGRGGDGGHSHYQDGGAAGEAGVGDPGFVGSGGGGGGVSGAAGGRGGDGLVVLIWGFEQPSFG